MMKPITPAPNATFSSVAVQPKPAMAVAKSILLLSVAVLALTGLCAAKDLPDAPSAVAAAADGFIAEPVAPRQALKVAETKPIDATFLGLALVSTGSTFADSYTTLFA